VRALLLTAAAPTAALAVGAAFLALGNDNPLVYPQDDTYIYLQYARRFAAGHGLSYTEGQPPAPGITGFLWFLLLTLGTKLAPKVSVLLPLVFGLISLAVLAHLSRLLLRSLGLSPALAALGAVLGVSVAGRFVWYGLTGMDTLSLALALVGMAWAWRAERSRYLVTFGLVAALARPEGVAFVLLAAALWRKPALALAAGLGLTYFGFNWALAGTPLPTTFLAKTQVLEGGFAEKVARTGRELGQILSLGFFSPAPVLYTGRFLPVVVVLIVMGWIALVFSPPRLLVWLLACALVEAALGPPEGYWIRYSAPVAAVAVVVAFGLWLRAWPWAGLALLALAASLTPAWALYYRGAVADVRNQQVLMARLVADTVPLGEVVAANDVGALAYYGGRPVVDMVGLVTLGMTSAHIKGDCAILDGLRRRGQPRWLVMFPHWFPGLAKAPGFLSPVAEVRLEKTHVAGGPALVIFQADWSRAACTETDGRRLR
jgi:hypothetical protein